MKILIVANCQGETIEALLRAGTGAEVERHNVHTASVATFSPEYMAGFEFVIAQDIRPDCTELWSAIKRHPNVVAFPWLLFFGLTPDHTTLEFPLRDNISRIVSCAWQRGLDRKQAMSLFNPEFLDAIGYYSALVEQKATMLNQLSRYTDRATFFFDHWYDQGNFFYTGNHPRSFVVEDILREVLCDRDIYIEQQRLASLIPDPLQSYALMPNLNHPRLTNLLSSTHHIYKSGERILTLEEMITQHFLMFEALSSLRNSDVNLARFDAAYSAWTGRQLEPMVNPYAGRPDWAFWSRTVARPAPGDVSPGDGLRPIIAPQTRVATAGSCFAQHVARAMVADGLTYYVAETAPPGMDAKTAYAQGYGLFSARYGNIYTSRQLLQLIRRAYGRFAPVETAWPVDGGFADPFRPNIGEVFPTIAALEAARSDHLNHVRRMFETLDVFVFTLGLTEGWVDRRDGAAFPVTPGAVTKGANPAHFQFLNLDHAAVKADLVEFMAELLAVNPSAQVILTVSPVPLIATYGPDDVLSATTLSKSVLRAAAGEVATLFAGVQYFPSYEIITGAFNRGACFAEDLRSIRPEGVAHVMQVFRKRLVVGDSAAVAPPPLPVADATVRAGIADEIDRQGQIVCDEELQVRGL